jgi:CRP-like cAMP-binding protein
MMTRPDRTDLVDHLKHVPYFAGLDGAALHELAALAIWQEYAPGAVIFLEGDASSGLYSVHTGWVKVIKLSPDGREQVLRYFGPGEVFNEIGRCTAQPCSRCWSPTPIYNFRSWATWPTASPIWRGW